MDVTATRADLPDSRRMSFWGHLEELRQRLKVVFVVDLILFVLFMTFTATTVSLGRAHVPCLVPTVGSGQAPVSGQFFDVLVHFLVPPWVTVAGEAPWSGVVVEAEVALFLMVVVSSPLSAYEFGKFLGPALKPSEKRLIMRLMAPALALFFVGIALDFFVLLPFTIGFLYAVQRGMGAGLYLLYMDTFVSFVLVHVIAFGIAFELPMIMYGLTSVGLVRGPAWRKHWRLVVAAIWLVAGMITPDPSGVTMVLVGLILTGLYVLGVTLANHAERVRKAKEASLPS